MTPLLALLVLPLAPGQDPAQQQRYAATFAGGGSVSWDELYLELARRHRGKPFGKSALDHLVEKRIVEREAKKRGVTAARPQVDAYIDTLRTQLRAQKKSLEEHLEGRAMGMAEFRAYVRLSLLYDRLARSDLGLGAKDQLTPDKRRLWLAEHKRRHQVEIDVAKLPAGAAAVVASEQLTLRDLGRAMARNIRDSERNSILRQMVAYRLLLRETDQRKIEVKDADYEKALAKKRADFAEDPNYKRLGVTLEKMLGAQGRSIDDLRRGEVFRAEVLVAILGDLLFPAANLKKDFEAKPRVWLGRVGGNRETLRILITGAPRRQDAKARDLCQRLRKRIKSPAQFRDAARRVSEDTKSKRRGGNLGYLHRNEEGFAEELLAAAFLLKRGEVSEPVKTKEVWNLLLVERVLPPPPIGPRLWAAMRRYRMGKWLRALVDKAEVKLFRVPKG